MQEQTKRGRGAPRTGRKTERIFPSLPKGTIEFIDWRIGEHGNLSAYLDERIKADPLYEEWQKTILHGHTTKEIQTIIQEQRSGE